MSHALSLANHRLRGRRAVSGLHSARADANTHTYADPTAPDAHTHAATSSRSIPDPNTHTYTDPNAPTYADPHPRTHTNTHRSASADRAPRRPCALVAW